MWSSYKGRCPCRNGKRLAECLRRLAVQTQLDLAIRKDRVHLQSSAHRFNEVLKRAEVDIRALLQLRDRRLRHVERLRQLLLCQMPGCSQLVQRHLLEILVGESPSFGSCLGRHFRPEFTEL